MITVACVLRAGGVYTSEWVDALQHGVAKHLSAAHRFVCLSDVPVHCDRIALETDWPGWWAKIELFRPGLFDGPVLFFDLDTVIVGPLDEIAAWPHRFTMVHEYNRPQFYCSTAMAWRGDFSAIWRAFAADPEGCQTRYRRTVDGRIGDQAFIEDALAANGVGITAFRDIWGERVIASYKVHRCQGGPPPDAVAVAFHGRPKPHQLGGWVADAWAS